MLPIPIRDDVQRTTIPTATYALIVVNVILFFLFNPLTINNANLKVRVAYSIGDRDIPPDIALRPAFRQQYGKQLKQTVIVEPQTAFAALYANLILHRSQVERKPWTLITHAFLHADLWHIVGNLWFLFVFGRSVEDKLRPRLFLPFYLIGAVAGALLFMLLSPVNDSLMKGASGAVFATLGMYLVRFPRARIELLFFFLFLLERFTIPAIWAVGMYAVYEFFLTLLRDGGGVAHSAHVGGFIAGLRLTLAARAHGWITLRHRRSFEFIHPRNIFIKPERRSGRVIYPDAPHPFAPGGWDAVGETAPNDPADDDDPPPDAEPFGAALSPELFATLEAAHLYLDDGDIDRALAAYLECARIDPNCALRPEHQRRIAGLLAQYGLWRQAVQANAAFISVYPSHRYAPDCHLTIGEIFVSRLNNERDAVPHLIIAAKTHTSPAMRNKARGLLALIRT